MVAGHATQAGTSQFADWAVAQRGANRGHFREVEGLSLSSLGIGTYLGDVDAETDRLVEEAIYVGDATRYRVGLGADGAVMIKVPNRVGARPPATGASVALAWSPEDTRLFPRVSA